MSSLDMGFWCIKKSDGEGSVRFGLRCENDLSLGEIQGVGDALNIIFRVNKRDACASKRFNLTGANSISHAMKRAP